MNQKMTQTCRSEKNRDLFGKSNLGKLNNYETAMDMISMAWRCAAGLLVTVAILTFQAVAASLPADSASEVILKVPRPADPAADAGVAIRATLDKAGSHRGKTVRIVLDEGIYRVSSLQPGNPFHLIFNGLENVTLQGVPKKTVLLFTHPDKAAIGLFGTRNVVLKDLIVDYDPLPFTQGTVVATDPEHGAFDWRPDAGYRLPKSPFPVSGAMGVIVDRSRRALKAKVPDYAFIKSAVPLNDGRWRLTFDPSTADRARFMAPGDAFVLLARLPGGTIEFNNASGGGIDGVTLHSSPGLSVLLNGCRDRIEVRGLQIVFKPGSDRLIASNGDGVHCGQNRKGPLIEHCLFEGLCDDGVNIYCTPARLEKELPKENAVLLSNAGHWQTGDRIEFFDLAEGRILAEIPIVTLTPDANGQIKAVFDSLPALAGKTVHLYNLSAAGENYIIRNNVFRNHRRHGLNLRAREGLIEHNRFIDQGGFGINISNEPGWPEGPTPSNLVIRDNYFSGGGQGAGYSGSEASAALRVMALKNSWLALPVVDHVKISGNEFSRPPGNVIFLGAVRHATLRDNRISGKTSVPLRIVARQCETIDSDTPLQP